MSRLFNKEFDVAFIGSRGIPASYGGFETFIEKVSIGLSKENLKILVICDRELRNINEGMSNYHAVSLKYTKSSKSVSPIRFYLESLILSSRSSKIVYCCGVGGSPFWVIPKIFNSIFMINPDGIGWKRTKWKKIKRFSLRFLFWIAAKFAPVLVYDSKTIGMIFKTELARKKSGFVIEYGSKENHLIGKDSSHLIEKYGVANSSKYHLVVSRLEPENNVELIIDGFIKYGNKFPLYIVGNIQETDYCRNLVLKAQNQNIIFLGGIYNEDELFAMRLNAHTYWHGHSVGGTNPSLLEAMASQNLCICHDNEFNREVLENYGLFFKTSIDVVNILSSVEIEQIGQELNQISQKSYERALSHYNWHRIIKAYKFLFSQYL